MGGWIEKWRKRCSAGDLPVVAGLATVAIVCVIYLVGADTPWIEAIQKRVDAGKTLKDTQLATIGLWWGSAIGLALSLVGIGLILIGRPLRPTGGKVIELSRPPLWMIVALLAIVVYGASLRAPRLGHSFWNDEEYGFRSYSWGTYEVQDDGALKFERNSWARTLFDFRSGNNHPLHSVEARVASAVRSALRDEDPENDPLFSERVARAFPFLSGLLSIAMIGVLGWVLGRPVTGLLGALLFAFSNWHIRYSVEARGYSSMMLFTLAAIVCLIRALDTGRWRWWIGYGVSQAAFLLYFAGSLYVAVALSLYGFLALALPKGSIVERARRVLPLIVAGFVTSMLVLPIMVPGAMQILHYMERSARPTENMDFVWYRDLWSHLVAGIPYSNAEPSLHLGTSMHLESAQRGPGLQIIGLLVWPALFLLGVIGLVLRGRRTAVPVVALLGGFILSCIHNDLGSSAMYGWYLIYVLPLVSIAMAWCVTEAAGIQKWLAAVPGVAIVAWLIAAAPARMVLGDHDRQPIRQAVAATRDGGVYHDGDRGLMTATFSTSTRQVLSYDPYTHLMKTRKDLDAVMAKARADEKRLRIFFCGRNHASIERKDILRVVEDPALFEKVGEVKGVEELFSYHIYEMR